MKHKKILISVLLVIFLLAGLFIGFIIWYTGNPNGMMVFPEFSQTFINRYIEYEWDSSKTAEDNVRTKLTYENGICTVTFTGNGEMMDFDPDSQDSWHALNNMSSGWIADIENVIIENGIESIGNYTFINNNIKKISVSSTVSYIGEHAFDNCMSLTDINYNGTIEQWNKIKFSNEWNHNSKISTIICSDGKIDIK